MNIYEVPNLISSPERKVYGGEGGWQLMMNHFTHTHTHTHTRKHTHTHTHNMSGREGYWDGKRYIFRASLKADVELEWRSEVRRDSSTGGKELRFKSSVCMYHCICVYMHVCVCVCVCVCVWKGVVHLGIFMITVRMHSNQSYNMWCSITLVLVLPVAAYMSVFKPVVQSVMDYYKPTIVVLQVLWFTYPFICMQERWWAHISDDRHFSSDILQWEISKGAQVIDKMILHMFCVVVKTHLDKMIFTCPHFCMSEWM